MSPNEPTIQTAADSSRAPRPAANVPGHFGRLWLVLIATTGSALLLAIFWSGCPDPRSTMVFGGTALVAQGLVLLLLPRMFRRSEVEEDELFEPARIRRLEVLRAFVWILIVGWGLAALLHATLPIPPRVFTLAGAFGGSAMGVAGAWMGMRADTDHRAIERRLQARDATNEATQPPK